MRKRKRLWVLLYKKDNDHKVWLYEKLRRKEISNRIKHGWRVIS